MSASTGRRAAALVAVALLTSTACGQASPPAAPDADTTTAVPTTARPTPSATGSAPPTTAPVTSAAEVYFLLDEEVTPVTRAVSPPSVGAQAVRALLAGPTPEERAAGLSSAIPAGAALRSLDIQDGLATVDLTGAYAAGGGSASMFARLAQLVFTLTRFTSVDRVALRLDGEPVEVFSGEGIVIDGPLSRADFEDQVPAVLIESPTFAAAVGSPLRVRGTANTFEAVFHLDLRDTTGRTVTTALVTATSGSGTRGAFDTTLSYRDAGPGTGTLVAWYSSPRDGSRVVVVEIPVVLG